MVEGLGAVRIAGRHSFLARCRGGPPVAKLPVARPADSHGNPVPAVWPLRLAITRGPPGGTLAWLAGPDGFSFAGNRRHDVQSGELRAIRNDRNGTSHRAAYAP